MLVAYFSNTFAYFVLCVISLSTCIALFSSEFISCIGYYGLFGGLSQEKLISCYPQASSNVITISFILISLMYLSLILFVVSFIINAFSVGMYLIATATGNYGLLSNPYLLILLPIAFMVFFAGPVQYMTIRAMIYVSNFIAHTFNF